MTTQPDLFLGFRVYPRKGYEQKHSRRKKPAVTVLLCLIIPKAFREITVGERTVAVIIRTQKGGEFNQGRYVPEENRYYESLGPRQTPCEMLPKY